MYCDDFNKVFPKYSMEYGQQATISESETNAKVKKVYWNGSTFQVFDTAIVKDLSGFFRIAKADDIFYKDCDGFFLLNENNGQKYMILTELKSTFDSSDIYKARNQILSSYIKFNLLLHLFQGYRPEDFIIKGFIVSKPFKKNYIRDLYKQTFLPKANRLNKESTFVLNLCNNASQSCILKPSDFEELKDIPIASPGIFKEIEFRHIDVENENGEIALNIKDFL